eukprot:16162021-Heterocapsa_arctica.AAC.1
MAVLVGVPDAPDISTKQHVSMVYGMRAVSGHFDEIDQSKVATRIRDEHYPLMSAIIPPYGSAQRSCRPPELRAQRNHYFEAYCPL